MTSLLKTLKNRIPQSTRNRIIHLPQALFANIRCGFPSLGMNIIGVTGTDGKTTTTSGIYHLLTCGHRRVGMITTVEAKLLDQHYSTGLHTTTPSASQVQNLLKQAKKMQITDMVIESTSHGLDQYRLWGIPYKIGVITNVTHEHFDYHKTYEQYLLAKARLLDHVKFAVLNRDDLSYEPLMQYLQDHNPSAQVISFGLSKNANVYASKISFQRNQTTFTLHHTFPNWDPEPQLTIPYLGEFNVYNALAMISSAWASGLPLSTVVEGIASLPPVKGRQDQLLLKNRHVVVDFAHTPNAMDSLLKSLKKIYSTNRLITVFGCTGERDRDKRPIMGEIASTLSDIVILTSDDTRSEKIEYIFAQIEPGCVAAGAKLLLSSTAKPPKSKTYFKIPDRKQAIEFAARISLPGDLLALLGKGHETSILLGDKEHPWSDQQAARDAFASIS